MARQSKSKTDVPETPTPTPAPTPVVETASAKVKKEAKPKVSKVETVVAPVVAPVVEVPPVVEEVEGAELVAQSTEFLAKLNQLSTLLCALKTEYRTLEKKWNRELKTAQKSQAKRKRKSGNRQPSGFVKPTKISEELAKFLEKPVGSEMARTDVTREINAYIRAHKLQDASNGRKINPDAKLAALLKLNKSDELTYFNLQKYMSPHFSKAEKATTTA